MVKLLASQELSFTIVEKNGLFIATIHDIETMNVVFDSKQESRHDASCAIAAWLILMLDTVSASD